MRASGAEGAVRSGGGGGGGGRTLPPRGAEPRRGAARGAEAGGGAGQAAPSDGAVLSGPGPGGAGRTRSPSGQRQRTARDPRREPRARAWRGGDTARSQPPSDHGRVPASGRGGRKLRPGPGEGRGAASGGARGGAARGGRPRHGAGGRGGALGAGLAGGRPLLPALPGRWRRGLRGAPAAAARLEDPAVARLPAALPAAELPERRQRRQAP